MSFIMQTLDEGSLGVLVSCLCATGAEQKLLARKVLLAVRRLKTFRISTSLHSTGVCKSTGAAS